MLESALMKTAVIGAAGKMGKGISVLLLQEIAMTEARSHGTVGNGKYALILIDYNENGLSDLKHYLKKQIVRFAEKNINELRRCFANNPSLISNEEIIDAFVGGANDIVFFDTELHRAKGCTLVFEAIAEDIEIKVSTFKELKQQATTEQYYLTNTSSIPISLLNEKGRLDHKIIGFHFYNPPTVQKLVEWICPEQTDSKLEKLSLDLIKSMKKIVVRSNDIAGFIGNGHFMRELLYACQQAKALSDERGWPLEKAIYLINRITQDFLIRPMGIFQLADFVGLDVCHNITKIMSQYLPEPAFRNEWLEKMVAARVLGGQFPDGKQKNGCFRYEQDRITGVYSLSDGVYWWEENVESNLQPFPEGLVSWKRLQGEKQRTTVLQDYFNSLQKTNSWAPRFALSYLEESSRIAQYLVDTHVASSMNDVDTVLQQGFYHLYAIEEGQRTKRT